MVPVPQHWELQYFGDSRCCRLSCLHRRRVPGVRTSVSGLGFGLGLVGVCAYCALNM